MKVDAEVQTSRHLMEYAKQEDENGKILNVS